MAQIYMQEGAIMIYDSDKGLVCLAHDVIKKDQNGIPYTTYYDFEIVDKGIFGQDGIGLKYVDGSIKIYGSIRQHTTPLPQRRQILFIPLEQGEEFWAGSFQYSPAYGYQMSRFLDKTIYDCEHMILADANHVLYIPYNPRISSLKTTILETKTDTIMGEYPFFVRNGNMRYKEIPLSGLISRQGDFINSFGYHPEAVAEVFERTSTPSIEQFETLTPAKEIYLERKHKLAVEQWLTNGEWKVLYTPTEGNYIVRLQNVSLAPNEQLARRLHTFSATALEVADYNFESLVKMGLIPMSSI